MFLTTEQLVQRAVLAFSPSDVKYKKSTQTPSEKSHIYMTVHTILSTYQICICVLNIVKNGPC